LVLTVNSTRDSRTVDSRTDFLFYLGVVYLLYLVPPVVSLFQAGVTPAVLAAVVCALAVFIASYVWLMRRVTSGRAAGRRNRAASAVGILTLVILASALVLAFGAPWLGLFIYASVLTGFAFPVWPALGTVGAVTAASVGIGLISGVEVPEVAQIAGLSTALGVGMLGMARLIGVNSQLRAARLEVARLAVAEERLRIARDLHDLLGHSLSLIAVKSELAGRLVASSPDRAAAEVHEIEAVARAALLQVRDAVSGYRQPTLVSELESARRMLAAAGVACQVDNDWPALPVVIESALSWALREGVTNVLRHSRCRQCVIRIVESVDAVDLEIVDDGPGRAVIQERGLEGSGLAGVAERLAKVGGSCSAAPLAGGGFRMAVRVRRST
jgi:two-component system sensor histidine kinase DesK